MNYYWTTFFHRLEKWRAVWAEIVLKVRWYLIHFFLFDSELPQNNRYFSTVLEVCFDRARGMFRPCSRYVSTVLEVCSDRARGMFLPCSAVLEVYFECARDMFWACSRYVKSLCSTQTPVSTNFFQSSTDMYSTLKVETKWAPRPGDCLAWNFVKKIMNSHLYIVTT